jgi:hypothetical protein
VWVFSPTETEEDAVPKATPLTRGDRRRNEKLACLRSIVRHDLAIVAVDLASAKQAAVVADHDSKLLGRRMFEGSPWCVDDVLDWAEPIAAAAGFAGIVLACEPTGHRWKPLLDRARGRGVELVCVQPMLVHRAREGEDFTKDRSDFKDATLIARLTGELRCYVPYALEGHWCRLRHLGARRSAQIVASTAARQALRDLLECAWPAVLATAAKPLDSTTWLAAMAVSTDPDEIVAMGYDTFAAAVTAELPRFGAKRRNHRILRGVFTAAHAPGGVAWEREAALERAAFAFSDWRRAQGEIACVEARMVEVLDALGLTELGHHHQRPLRRGRRRHPGRGRRSPTASTAPAPGSSTPASARAPTSRARSRARRRSRVGAGPTCAPPPGAPYGERCRTMPSTPTGSITSSLVRTTRSRLARPGPPSPPPFCASSSSWSPSEWRGIRPSPPARR